MSSQGYDPFKFGEVELEDQKAAAEARKASGESIPEDLLFSEDTDKGSVKPLTDIPAPKAVAQPKPPASPKPSGDSDGWAPLKEDNDDLPRRTTAAGGDKSLATLFDGPPAGAKQRGATPTADIMSNQPAPPRNPLPPVRSPEPDRADMPQEQGRRPGRPSDRDEPRERPQRREPLPKATDHQARPTIRTRPPARCRIVPLLILLGGLGLAAFFCVVVQNYPVAIFLALMSIVAAPLARLLLNNTPG